jgi:hypothetical protein
MKTGSVVAVVALTAVAVSAGCETSVGGLDGGAARVSVVAGAETVLSDGAVVRLVLDDHSEAPTFAPRSMLLTPAPANRAWTANMTSIPALPVSGSVRHFRAEAFAGAPGAAAPLFAGDALASIVAGRTAQVIIFLQKFHVPPQATNHVPVILSLGATSDHALPGESGSFSVSATDPDGNGFDANHPLLFAWSSRCIGADLRLGTPENTSGPGGVFASAIAWTAPEVATVCTATVEVRENPAVIPIPLWVTANFTLIVDPDRGNADVLVLPNGPPIVTVAGDFQYPPAACVAGGPLGPRGDLHVGAIDPDGDDLRFELSAKCGADLASAAASPDIASTYFSAVTFTSAGGSGVSSLPSLVRWDPTFGYPAPVATYPYPAQDCIFRVDVHDLCTRGNCGPPGAQGAQPDGTDKTTLVGGASVDSVATGYVFVTHPASALVGGAGAVCP